jgi:hypothetical protein
MKRSAVWIAAVYFVAMAVAITFPGIRPFNTIRPFVFGIPFVFAWVLSWVLGALVVFAILYRTYHK